MSTELYPPLGPTPDPYWATVANWYIDPAGTHSPPGNDSNSGLSAASPIKSIAEWRKRIRNAAYTGNTRVVIHALSSSTVMDDGQFYGFSTELIANTSVVVVGVPTVVGTGTITTYQPYAGNTRGSIEIAGLPTSWTASDFVSTTTYSRFIRKAGGGTVPYASVLKDLGAKTAQMGIVTNWDETNTTAVTFTETNFTNGDSIEIVSMPRWPQLQSHTANVRYQCLDVFDTPVRVQIYPTTQNNFVLCGFVGRFQAIYAGNVIAYNCAFLNTACVYSGPLFPANCSFLNILVQAVIGCATLKSATNVFVGCRLYFEKAGIMGDTGVLRIYDATDPCLQLSTGSRAYIFSMVGEGNTNKLVYVDRGSQVYGAGNIAATTTDVTPYYVNGVSAAAPFVDAVSGDAIYT